ncbi:phage antirepressor [Actinoallomurus vinaceus]|uniref:phage antirepressor n=1 Tax=Actinoallomurus vinaceus TaxID=1080074 RepID=UPI0031F107C5
MRTVLIDGEPWFVAADVCAVLDLGNPRSSLALLDDDERGVYRVDTPGGPQNATIVNEAGLYSLILRSRKPEARAFKRWVTHDVLPAIRRTGSYAAPAFEVPKSLPDALRAYAAEVEAHEETKRRAAELEGPAHSWNVLASGAGDYSVADAAKILSRDPAISIGERRLFTELAVAAWIYRARSDGRWRAYQRYVDSGRLSELPQSYEHPQTGEIALAAPQVRITVKGVRELHHQLGGVAPVQFGEQLSIGGA